MDLEKQFPGHWKITPDVDTKAIHMNAGIFSAELSPGTKNVDNSI